MAQELRAPWYSKAAPVSSEPEWLLAPRAHLSRSRLYSFQQVWYCPSKGPCSSEQVLPTAQVIVHEGCQQFHTLGHLSQVGRNGGDCTTHSCIVSVGRVTWDRQGPSPSKEGAEGQGEPWWAGGEWPHCSSWSRTTLQESDTRHCMCTVRWTVSSPRCCSSHGPFTLRPPPLKYWAQSPLKFQRMSQHLPALLTGLLSAAQGGQFGSWNTVMLHIEAKLFPGSHMTVQGGESCCTRRDYCWTGQEDAQMPDPVIQNCSQTVSSQKGETSLNILWSTSSMLINNEKSYISAS